MQVVWGFCQLNGTLLSTNLAVQDDQLGLSHLSATICAELAAGLADAEGIRAKYELTEAQWEKLKNNVVFRGMLKDALQKFSGDIGTSARIKMKAEILLEDSLPVLDKLIHDAECGAGSRLDSIKQLTVLAEKSGGGKGEKSSDAQHGFNVGIYINTGEGNDAAPPTIISLPAEED